MFDQTRPDVVTLENPFDNIMKRFCLYSQCSHLTKPLDVFSPEGGCSEGLDAFRYVRIDIILKEVVHNRQLLLNSSGTF